MNINATFINLYHVSKRERWLHVNGVRREVIYDGKLLHETGYSSNGLKNFLK